MIGLAIVFNFHIRCCSETQKVRAGMKINWLKSTSSGIHDKQLDQLPSHEYKIEEIVSPKSVQFNATDAID